MSLLPAVGGLAALDDAALVDAAAGWARTENAVIQRVTGVLLDADEAQYVVKALELLTRLLGEQRSQPTPRLQSVTTNSPDPPKPEALQRRTESCGHDAGTAQFGCSSG